MKRTTSPVLSVTVDSLKQANDGESKIQGKLECSHSFCFDCIMDWSKVTNMCPLCKREFFKITKQTYLGMAIEEVPIQPKIVNLDELLQDADLQNGTCFSNLS